jgi:hypothetical protein
MQAILAKVLLHIFLFLNNQSLRRASCVSQRWALISKETYCSSSARPAAQLSIEPALCSPHPLHHLPESE